MYLKQNKTKYCACEYKRYPPSTLFSSGVIVAHLIPTLYLAIASAQSTVTTNNITQATTSNNAHPLVSIV